MLSLQEFKNILGNEALKYSDEEIKILRDAQRNLAEIIFEKWFEERDNKRGYKNIEKQL